MLNILSELLIIFTTAAAGMLASLIPGFPFPGPVAGMLIMAVLLVTGILDLKKIHRAADFFTASLPLFFIPLIINLMKETEILGKYGLKIGLIVIISTVLTMAVTALTVSLLFRLSAGRRRD